MKRFISMVVSLAVLLPATAMAAKVTEGEEAKKLFEAEKATAVILMQKDKKFVLRHKGADTPEPKEIKVKVGERVFITNDEEKIVHNVYDSTESDWVLKKQEPSSVAAVAFEKAGTHNILCAIHPQMVTTVIVQ